jgi:hypothetical protein
MIASSGSVIGVDVGFSAARRSSAICRLDWSLNTVEWEIDRFRALEAERTRAIANVATGHLIAAAAFDGPVRKGFDLIGRYRTAERMLTRRLGRLIGKPGQSSAPVGKLLNFHANECARELVAHCEVMDARHESRIDRKALVEAFPSSFLGMMIPNPAELVTKRGDRSDKFFEVLLETGRLRELIDYLFPGRRIAMELSRIVNHDDRAAYVCALTAACVASGDFVATGDDDGWICLPPRSFIEPLQWSMLTDNAHEERSTALLGSGPALRPSETSPRA